MLGLTGHAERIRKGYFQEAQEKYFYIVTCKNFNINFMGTPVHALLLNINAGNLQYSSVTFGQVDLGSHLQCQLEYREFTEFRFMGVNLPVQHLVESSSEFS